MKNQVRAIALYLPQYHPIPENNKWWGNGFTEWTNVAKAKPLFNGHIQPNLPADLGFYDLRLNEVRCAQADLARVSGIEGFCYYHYWFGNGKQLLERPFNEVLDSGEPDFPFCLAWANQTWTGIWHGLDNKILIEQTYPGDADHQKHFEYLLRAFADPRYISVDKKPLFMIYRPLELPGGERTLDYFRELAVKAGLPGLYLVAQHNDLNPVQPPRGYDAFICQRSFPRRPEWTPYSSPLRKIYYKYLDYRKRPSISEYKDLIEYFIPDSYEMNNIIPCVISNWDNTPRSGHRGVVLQNSTPELFSLAMQRALKHTQKRTGEEKLLFIKSWNEWAEGNYLEPDARYGHAYLDALRTTLCNTSV